MNPSEPARRQVQDRYERAGASSLKDLRRRLERISLGLLGICFAVSLVVLLVGAVVVGQSQIGDVQLVNASHGVTVFRTEDPAVWSITQLSIVVCITIPVLVGTSICTGAAWSMARSSRSPIWLILACIASLAVAGCIVVIVVAYRGLYSSPNLVTQEITIDTRGKVIMNRDTRFFGADHEVKTPFLAVRQIEYKGYERPDDEGGPAGKVALRLMNRDHLELTSGSAEHQQEFAEALRKLTGLKLTCFHYPAARNKPDEIIENCVIR